MRLEGKTFTEIGETLSLGERQVRRHYEEFLLSNNEVYSNEKHILFGQIFSQFEYSLENANRQLAAAMKGDNAAKVAVWQKIRQECLRDFYSFLKDLNFNDYWAKSPEEKKADSEKWNHLYSM